MAHRVKVKRSRLRKKDGTASGKYQYNVVCSHKTSGRTKKCLDVVCTSAKGAEQVRDEHFAQMREAHSLRCPNGRGAKPGPTRARKTPQPSHGEKYMAGVPEEIRTRVLAFSHAA